MGGLWVESSGAGESREERMEVIFNNTWDKESGNLF